MKQCTRCKEVKSLDQFNKDKKTKSGFTYHCKSCVAYYCKTRNGKVDRNHINTQNRLWKQANPDKVRAQQIKQNFGLSYNEYIQKLENQKNSCAICKTPLIPFGSINDTDKISNVDHCHTTNKIRGLLCRKCNTALGLFSDNIDTIIQAANYLKEYKDDR